MLSRKNGPSQTLLVLAVAIATSFASSGCTAQKTQSANAPDVDTDVGRWSRYNLKWADVDVGTTTKTITVPKLEWKREQMQIQVPYIDINVPGAGEREERTISVELEVPDRGYNLQIREIRAAGNELWVISELRETDNAGKGYGRVSDQVVVKAPSDLHIRRAVIGERPEGVYNQQYTFYPDLNALQQHLPQGAGRILYERRT